MISAPALESEGAIHPVHELLRVPAVRIGFRHSPAHTEEMFLGSSVLNIFAKLNEIGRNGWTVFFLAQDPGQYSFAPYGGEAEEIGIAALNSYLRAARCNQLKIIRAEGDDIVTTRYTWVYFCTQLNLETKQP